VDTRGDDLQEVALAAFEVQHHRPTDGLVGGGPIVA
jgi:hypothetical protein